MTLSEIKRILLQLDKIAFELPNGNLVPPHFHVTEVGEISKTFIDCGGTIRKQEVANFQLWEAGDYDHRIHPEKLVHIIELAEKALGLGDLNIEVEYQGVTIGKYGLEFNGTHFLLMSKQTDCLAKEKCNISLEMEDSSCCAPNAECC